MAAVRADGLAFRYAGAPAPALDGVSFSVSPGEVFGVLGPNGAGKTTLLKLVATVFVPQEGALEVLGEPLPAREDRVRRRIGVAFAEYERSFSYRLTGRQNLEFFGALQDLPRAQARRRASECLSLVGLDAKADALFQSYSTGMKHRLGLARALMPEPDLLVLDEPTAGLDPQTTRELGATLRRLAAEGATLLYTTHRLEEAAALCDRVLILKEGRKVAMASPAELSRLARDVSVVSAEVRGVLPDVAALSGLPGAVSVALEGRSRLRVQTTDVDATVRALLDRLARAGLALERVETSSAGLAEAFSAVTEGRLAEAAA